MKQKIKNYLKFGILLFGVSLILTNCQKDDDFHSTNKNPNTINKSNYKIKNINLKDLQRNKSVFQKISKINFKTANKIVNDTINGFSIDTETGIYIENGNYHSYTFRIDRATPSNYLLENLVLSKKDTSYQTILYQYNITHEEFNLISQQQFVNLEGKITLTLIDNNTLSENILGKYFFNGNCYKNDYVYVEGQTCGGTGDQNHTYLEAISGQYCSQLGTEYGPTPSGYVYQSVQVACDATTGGGINNSNTPTNNNHGGINNDNHATSPNTFCSRCDDLEDPDIDVQDDDDCDTSKEDLKKVFPSTSDDRLQEIADAINDNAKDFGIDTKEKLQHFISQAGHESANFTDFIENLNYRVKKLGINYWKSKFNPYTAYIDSLNIEIDSTKQNPNDYASSTSTVYVDNEDFANFVYDDANRGTGYKLGNTSEGDGYKYRGRGIFQLTGKTNYTNFNTYYQDNINEEIDLLETPDLVASNIEIAVISALWFYENMVLDNLTIDSTTTVKKVTKKINAGSNGLVDREEIFEDCLEHIDCVD